MRKHRHTADFGLACPLETTLDLMGGKWKGCILFRLLYGTRRFGELKRMLGTISQRTLTQQLRELEADGFVHREIFAQVPPRVDYSLTARGRSLEPVLRGLMAWGVEHACPPRLAAPAPDAQVDLALAA